MGITSDSKISEKISKTNSKGPCPNYFWSIGFTAIVDVKGLLLNIKSRLLVICLLDQLNNTFIYIIHNDKFHFTHR